MTTLFRNFSIRRKQMLIIMLTSTVALLLACAAFVFCDVLNFRLELVERIGGIAQVIAEHSTASLDFSDPKTAEQTLAALNTEPEVVAACIYDRDGRVFAEFIRDRGAKFVPPPFRANGQEFTRDRVRLFRPIIESGETIGAIYVESDLKELPRRLGKYAEIAGIVFVVSLLAALVLSSWLQRVLSNPILRLAKMARSVAVEKNYSVRAKKTSEDELGQLIDGFNDMLAQIQQRENALQAARDTLENRVEERTNELANSLSLLNATLNSTEDGILAVDLEGRVICHNDRFPAMWSMPEKTVATRRNEAFVEHCATMVDDPKSYFMRVQELLLQPEKATHDVLSLRDGRYFERVVYPQLMNGRCIGRVLMFRDITERKRAESNLQKANAELVQASRRAGMAEIATNVLHNVGNVLNSVNISAELVLKRVKKSKASGLARVVALLREHEQDLGAFIAQDDRGRHLPAHLANLSTHLMADEEAIVRELDSLRQNVGHINDIVATQQKYAVVGGVKETIAVVDLVEDSLRMSEGALRRHRVEFIREFEDVPPLNLEKHKILQILVNLVRNAKHACQDSDRLDKRLTLRVTAGEGRVRISVTDNGVGVPPGNLTRIFNHGFTTRKDGHGFGLHSGALAAKEMGGSLTVQSDGPGQGATFTLELPCPSEEAPNKSHAR